MAPTTDVISSYLLTLGALTVMLLIWVTRQRRTGKDATVWLISGLTGVVLGAAGLCALVHATGHHVEANKPPLPTTVAAASGSADAPASATPSPGGMGGGMGMGMGGGGGRAPSPKRQLTTLVRKLELLTGDVALTLSPEQQKAIAGQLAALAEAQSLTDEQAEQQYNALLEVLDESQKAKQDAIGLPFGRGGRPGGGGGMGGGGEQPPPDENPFAQADNAKTLESLRARLQP